jgi:hypothetical protein
MAADAVVRLGFQSAELDAGLKRSAAHVKNFSDKTRVAFGGLGGSLRTAFASGMGMLGAGAGIAGIRSIVNEADRVGDLAASLGVTAEEIQRIGLYASQSGSDTETIVKSLHRVNKALTTAAGKSAFRELNIDVGKYKGLQADKQVIMLATAFQKAEARGEGLSQAYALLSKGAADMLPLLRTNVDELEKLSQATVISDAQVARIQEWNDLLDRTGKSLKANIGGGLVDATNIVTDFWAAMKDVASGGGGWEAFFQRSQVDEPAQKAADSLKRELKNKADQARELEELAKELQNQKRQTGDQEGGTVDKLTTARGKVRDIDEQISGAKKALRSMLSIEKAYKKEVEDAAEKQKQQQDAISKLSALMKVESLRMEGKKREAAMLEREIKLREEAARIAKETGMTEAQALEHVRQRTAFEDKAAKRGSGKIQGYTQDRNKPRPSALDPMYGIADREPIGRRLYKPGASPGLENLRRLNSLERNEQGKLVRPTAFPVRMKQDATTKAVDAIWKSIENKMDKLVTNTAPILNG